MIILQVTLSDKDGFDSEQRHSCTSAFSVLFSRIRPGVWPMAYTFPNDFIGPLLIFNAMAILSYCLINLWLSNFHLSDRVTHVAIPDCLAVRFFSPPYQEQRVHLECVENVWETYSSFYAQLMRQKIFRKAFEILKI